MPESPSWEERRITNALTNQPVIDGPSFFINQGRAFTVSDRIANVGNGDSIYVFIDNPSDSGFDYDVVLNPRAAGEADINVSFGASAGNTGTEVTAHNLKSGSSRTFSGTVEESDETNDTGTFPSHGTTIIQDFLPGGTQGVKVGPSAIGSVTLTIDEGSNKLFELVNQSGGGAKLAINIVIYEVDGTWKAVNGG